MQHCLFSSGRLAQLVERLPYKQNVGGSIPSAPTKFSFFYLFILKFCVEYLYNYFKNKYLMRNPYQRKATSSVQKNTAQATDQYKAFIEKIVSDAKVFALYDEGWALCATPTGQQAVAVWHSKSLAQLLVKDNWSRFDVQEVNFISFIEQMIPFIQQNDTLLSINLTPEGQNILVSGRKFLLDIKSYLYQLYIAQPELFRDQTRIPLPRKIRIHP